MSGSTDWLSFHGFDNRIPADERVLLVDARGRVSSERIDRRVDEHEGHARCRTILHRQENQHTDNASRIDVQVLIVFRFSRFVYVARHSTLHRRVREREKEKLRSHRRLSSVLLSCRAHFLRLKNEKQGEAAEERKKTESEAKLYPSPLKRSLDAATNLRRYLDVSTE